MILQTFFSNAHIREFDLETPFYHILPINTEITQPIYQCLLKRSICEKEKTKLEGDATQDKKRKELLKKYRKANKSWLKDGFNGSISTEK